MFHSSTTLWRHPRQPNSFFKENRRVFLLNFVLAPIQAIGKFAWDKTQQVGGYAWDKGKAATKWGWGKTIEAGKWGWKTTKAVSRYPWDKAVSSTEGLRHAGGDVASWAYYKGAWVARYGKELGMAVAHNSIFNSVKELLTAPVMYMKRMLIDNTRDILGGFFSMPKRIWEIFGNTKEALKSTISETRTEIGNVFRNIWDLKPVDALKNVWGSARASVGGVLKTAYQPFRPITEPLGKVASNVALAYWEYPKRLWGMIQRNREAIDRVGHAGETATAEVEASKAARAAAKAPAPKEGEQKEGEEKEKKPPETEKKPGKEGKKPEKEKAPAGAPAHGTPAHAGAHA